MSPGPLQSDSLPYLMACQVVHPLQWLLFNHSSSQCGPITTADPNPYRRIPCTPTSLLWDSAVCTSQFGQPCLDLNVDKGGWSLLEAHASVYRSLQSRWPAFWHELPRDTYCSACRSMHTCWRYHSCGMNDAMLLVSSQLMKTYRDIHALTNSFTQRGEMLPSALECALLMPDMGLLCANLGWHKIQSLLDSE